LFQKNITIHPVSYSQISLTVLDGKQPLENTTIQSKSHIPPFEHHLPNLTLQLPLAPRAYLSSVSISNPFFADTTYSIRVGALPYGNYSVPSVHLAPAINQTLCLNGTVHDFHMNETVPSGKAVLKKGAYSASAFLTQTFQNNTFSFCNLEPGVYTLEVSADKKHTAVLLVTLSQNKQLKVLVTPFNLSPDMIRFVLGWEGQTDLDIHAVFNTNKSQTCLVDFANPKCGGAKLKSSENQESLTLREVGTSHYLLFVKKYSKSEGTLGTTGAWLSTYIADHHEPVSIVGIPYEDSQKDAWLGLCLEGRRGVKSLVAVNQLLEYNYSTNYKQVCKTLLGKERWPQEELEAGEILVE